jgi:hypothetical protein
MIKTRFTADLGNGQTATRTSTGFAYTHAVVNQTQALSWHTSRELAGKGLQQATRWAGCSPNLYRVVKVTGEVIQPKRTSAADKNAARRGVLTREIARLVEHLAHTEAEVLRWEGGVAAENKTRLIRNFGEEEGLRMHTRWYAEVLGAPAYTRERIAKLEQERDALLAAKAEG